MAGLRRQERDAEITVVERELVGGECSYWACIPSKTLLRPGEALQAARDAPGAREAVSGGVRPEGAFEWRDFMVADYEDAFEAAMAAWAGGSPAARLARTARNLPPSADDHDDSAESRAVS